MLQIGLSINRRGEPTGDFLRSLADGGIQAVELSSSALADMPEDFDFRGVKAMADGCGIRLWSVHLPFAPFEQLNPASPDGAVRRFTKAHFENIIRRAAAVGIDKFVVHPSGEPNAPETREEALCRSMEVLSDLADFAAGYGAVIAVENLPRTCLGNRAAELKRIVSANDRLRVCFDLNHSLGEDNRAYFRALADKIVTLHVSDYDGVDERHWLPGEGKTDWVAMVDELENMGYAGVWMYEVNFNAPATIRRRTLTPADFAENARAVLNRRTIPVWGTPLV